MATNYTKDKTARLSFRVNEALAAWVGRKAQNLGVSPCDFARSVLFSQMAMEQALRDIDTKPPVAGIARAKKCEHKKQ
jgi:hypothetical protein